MKVIGIMGSPRKNGNTDTLVNQVLAGAEEKGAEIKTIRLNQLNIKGCQACMHCRENEGCAIKDDMQDVYREIDSADAIVIGSPVYMFQVTSQIKTFMDRLLPYMKTDYSPRINKKAVLVYSQGNPDTNAFKPYLESTKAAFDFLGIKVRNVIIDGGNSGKSDVLMKKELLQNAKKIGADLL